MVAEALEGKSTICIVFRYRSVYYERSFDKTWRMSGGVKVVSMYIDSTFAVEL
jgi:hypothetical protein